MEVVVRAGEYCYKPKLTADLSISDEKFGVLSLIISRFSKQRLKVIE